MESNLIRAIKARIFDELADSANKHPGYDTRIKIFHKFPEEERPQMGILVKNSSATRIRMSADDFVGEMRSHLALAKDTDHDGISVEWVWEDFHNLTKFVTSEDVSSQLDPTTRVFYTAHKPIVSGEHNSKVADNFAQVEVFVNGEKTFPEFVEGSRGLVVLSVAPPEDAEVLISYHYKNLTPPGRYYLGMTEDNQYTILPLYIVEKELVIGLTTGLELTSSLDHSNVFAFLDKLYTQKTHKSEKLVLEKGVDYTLATSGVITFLNPLVAGTSLYANYRWEGTIIGPLPLPNSYYADNTSLPGVVIAFGARAKKGDRLVILVHENRELASKVYGGHWRVSLDISIFTRSPQELAELTDHIIDDLWARKRNKLIYEGITLEELEPTGESEEVYDANTGDIYFTSSINLVLMSEWKRFVPYEIDLEDFSTIVHPYPTQINYVVSNQNMFFQKLTVKPSAFEVKYPVTGYPKII